MDKHFFTKKFKIKESYRMMQQQLLVHLLHHASDHNERLNKQNPHTGIRITNSFSTNL